MDKSYKNKADITGNSQGYDYTDKSLVRKMNPFQTRKRK